MNTEKKHTAGIAVGSCWKCTGLGVFETFRHVANGVCFACLGSRVKLYLPREAGEIGPAMRRADRIEIVRQALNAYTWAGEDEFVKREVKKVRADLRAMIVSVIRHADLDVFDRSIAALEKLEPLRAHEVARLRAKVVAHHEGPTLARVAA